MVAERICFVVMGFGKKTDFESGRTLDLDATYEGIIQPAVASKGLRCVRANEVLHSGVIDTKMYEMLLMADLVVADISTGNVNAVYELGVRHALRPRATIIMKEDKGKLHFDLDHVNTFQYSHLGEDIGVREAARAIRELSELIEKSMSETTPDSPVYTFLPKLSEPKLTDKEFEDLVDQAEQFEETFTNYLDRAESAVKQSNHAAAAGYFSLALDMNLGDAYLTQQLALHTYKSEQPSKIEALYEAQKILASLQPETSNDPETLGISGAIYKNIWLETENKEALDKAIMSYQRGFDLRSDYYNGENAASCLEMRSLVQTDSDEALFDMMSARKTRESILVILSGIVSSEDFDQRSDELWIYATMANCYFALGDNENGAKYEANFMDNCPVNWQKMTFLTGKNLAQEAFKSLYDK